MAPVTGAGRRRGIGAAICRALAYGGADVFHLLGRLRPGRRAGLRGKGAEAPARGIAQHGRQGGGGGDRPLATGLPERLLDDVAGRLGQPSILVNNAAYSTRDGFEELDAATLDAHYAVNVRATALPACASRGGTGRARGRIINLTSGQSLGPMPGELAYAATKGAIEAFTITLAAEVGHKGITVNAVNLGPTDTGWMTEELKRELVPRFVLGRVGEPGDVARLVAFLASEEAAWITGQVIHSEGASCASEPAELSGHLPRMS